MILVIVGHAIQTIESSACESNHLWNMIYSFHMPAFVAISGWLAYRQSISPLSKENKLIIRRFKQLMIPYFLWSLVMYIIIPGKQLHKIVTNPDSYFWFLWVLFFVTVIFIIAQILSRLLHVDEILIHVCFCVFLPLMMVIFNFRLFGFQFIAYYFFFYTSGYYFHKFGINNFVTKPFIILLILIWIVLAWNWNMHEVPLWLKYLPISETILLIVYRTFTAFLAIVVILCLSPMILTRKSNTNMYLASFGIFSLGIYVVHMLLADIVKIFDIFLPVNIVVAEMLLSVSLVIVSFVAVKILSCNMITSQYLLGKF